ncbi:MAG: type II secretion system F family protein [Gammaproteobacteria bacterium]
MSPEQFIFLIMVFLAVVLLATSIFVPTVGASAKAGRKMRARIHGLVDQLDPTTTSLLNEKYLRDLSSFGRWMQQLPGMTGLSERIEQAGWKIPAHKLVMIAVSLMLMAIFIVSLVTHQILFGLLVGAAIFYLPFLKMKQESQKRLMQFEEQFPDALDSMSRALRAGHPFNESIRLVAEEMDDPIGGEFQTTFSDINYGVSTKVAFYALLKRVPSISLLALVTAVLVQRETGGNLAEILDKIASVVRGRFRFQRRIKTISAEGRMSAWVLTLVPFVLAFALWLTTPDYLPMLVGDPLGRKLIMGTFMLVLFGILWMRRIIRIQV